MRFSTQTLALLALVTAIYFGGMIVLSEIYLSADAGLLDGRVMGYDRVEVDTYLGLLSAEGLQFYTGVFRLLDTVFPPLLGLTFWALIWTLGAGLWRVAVVFPVVYVFADLRENALVGQILKAGVGGSDAKTVAAASDVTQIKWLLFVLSLGVVLWLWKKGRNDI